MTGPTGSATAAPVARLLDVTLVYGKTRALDAVTLDIPAGRMVGLIGPDGVGKSSLLSLVAGARTPSDWAAMALGGILAPLCNALLGKDLDLLAAGLIGGTAAYLVGKTAGARR